MHCRQFGPISFHGSNQVDLNRLLDLFEPLLGTIRAILDALYLSLKLRYSILRGPQLDGELVRHRYGTLHIFIRGMGSLMEHRHESVSRLIDWVSSILWRLLRREYKQLAGTRSSIFRTPNTPLIGFRHVGLAHLLAEFVRALSKLQKKSAPLWVGASPRTGNANPAASVHATGMDLWGCSLSHKGRPPRPREPRGAVGPRRVSMAKRPEFARPMMR
jgi:hypothetical protein